MKKTLKLEDKKFNAFLKFFNLKEDLSLYMKLNDTTNSTGKKHIQNLTEKIYPKTNVNLETETKLNIFKEEVVCNFKKYVRSLSQSGFTSFLALVVSLLFGLLAYQVYQSLPTFVLITICLILGVSFIQDIGYNDKIKKDEFFIFYQLFNIFKNKNNSEKDYKQLLIKSAIENNILSKYELKNIFSNNAQTQEENMSDFLVAVYCNIVMKEDKKEEQLKKLQELIESGKAAEENRKIIDFIDGLRCFN